MAAPCSLCGEEVNPGQGALGFGGYVHGDPRECPVQLAWLKSAPRTDTNGIDAAEA